MDSKSSSTALNIPGAIIVAGAIIAIAIIWNKSSAPAAPVVPAPEDSASSEIVLDPVNDADHILGNPNAPVMIVEYSDTACPFCKAFHPTMLQIMNDYGADGKVAWVYRHFPLNKPDANGRILHPNAGKEAEALECAAEQGGNDKFWAYTNRLYEITPSVTGQSPQGLDQTELPKIAEFVGLDVDVFNQCLVSGRFASKVEKHYLSGINAGVAGTPHSILISRNGTKVPVSGAQPYSVLKAGIESMLAE